MASLSRKSRPQISSNCSLQMSVHIAPQQRAIFELVKRSNQYHMLMVQERCQINFTLGAIFLTQHTHQFDHLLQLNHQGAKYFRQVNERDKIALNRGRLSISHVTIIQLQAIFHLQHLLVCAELWACANGVSEEISIFDFVVVTATWP